MEQVLNLTNPTLKSCPIFPRDYYSRKKGTYHWVRIHQKFPTVSDRLSSDIRDVLDCVEDLVEGLTSYLNRDQLQKRKQTTNPDENLALEVSQKFHRSFLVLIFLFNVNSRLEEYLCIQNELYRTFSERLPNQHPPFQSLFFSSLTTPVQHSTARAQNQTKNRSATVRSPQHG